MKSLQTSMQKSINVNESLNNNQKKFINYVANIMYFIRRYGSGCIDISDFKYAVMDYEEYAPRPAATPEFYKKLGETIFDKLS